MKLTFQIDFHGPFRVATGRAGDGADSVVDPDLLLPASTLKGVMRSAARDLLKLPRELLDPVFGTSHQASPWSWSDGVLDAGPASTDGHGAPIRARARIQIAHDTSTVVDGALAVAEEVLAGQASFTVRRSGPVDAAALRTHRAVLVASARATTAIGGDRRRGLGWVSIVPTDPQWTDDSAADLVSLLHPGRGEEVNR